jgi:hypothetical protein
MLEHFEARLVVDLAVAAVGARRDSQVLLAAEVVRQDSQVLLAAEVVLRDSQVLLVAEVVLQDNLDRLVVRPNDMFVRNVLREVKGICQNTQSPAAHAAAGIGVVAELGTMSRATSKPAAVERCMHCMRVEAMGDILDVVTAIAHKAIALVRKATEVVHMGTVGVGSSGVAGRPSEVSYTGFDSAATAEREDSQLVVEVVRRGLEDMAWSSVTMVVEVGQTVHLAGQR